MKFVEPFVSEVRAIFGAPFKRSDEYKLLAAALDNIAQSDKPWMMERIVSSFPATMSRYERRKLKKIAEAHGKVIEAQLYRQALCRFSLGEDVDMEKEASNARSLGRYEYERQERTQSVQAAQKAVGSIGAAYQKYLSTQEAKYKAAYDSQNRMFGGMQNNQVMMGQIPQEQWEELQRSGRQY